MPLYNTIDKKVLEEELEKSPVPRTTISFYKYHNLSDPQAFRDDIYGRFAELGVLGRVYVAGEGINAQISVPDNQFTAFRDYLYSINWLNGCRLNIAVEDDGKSFAVLKILVRPKIVADGLDDKSFDPTAVGRYLRAAEFNAITANADNTILVDMRNHYESEVGHFKNAVTPDVDTFRDSLPIIEDLLKGNEDKNLVMYCTGGIRCEKASAWFRHRGFKNVHHLEGGIINYFHQVEQEGLENRFIGKNFVFDRRMGERITHDVIAMCHQCGKPCDDHTNCANDGCHLLFIQCPDCREQFEGCCSEECHAVIHLPEAEQKALRKGRKAGKIYKKGRSPKLKFKS